MSRESVRCGDCGQEIAAKLEVNDGEIVLVLECRCSEHVYPAPIGLGPVVIVPVPR